MTVSQAVVEPASVSSTALLPYSCLRVKRIIFWLGLWIASLAGFCCAAVMGAPGFELSEPFCETDAEPETMLMALAGRVMSIGLGLGALAPPPVLLEPHVSGVKRERLEGCWRTWKTKVLFMTRRLH